MSKEKIESVLEKGRDCTCAKCGKSGKTLREEGSPVWCPDCIDNAAGPNQRVVACRKCGVKGIEDLNDPVPGICPECLEAELEAGLSELLGEEVI